MAALQKIRNKAGLLVGVIAVALLAFIFPWNEVSTFINKQRDKAFIVDGDIVTTGDYLNRISQFEDFQKMITGQGSFDENTTAQIREFVYEQMVKEIMLDKEAEILGLNVSDEELRDLTIGSNPSPVLRQMPFFTDPQTGQFSYQALTEFLSFINSDPKSISDQQKGNFYQLQEVWNIIQNMIKYQRLEEKYNTLLARSIIVNDIETKVSVDAAKATSDIAYVMEKYSSIPDSAVNVSQKEIEALYNQRKNNFKNPQEIRTISYFSKEISPSESDFEAVEKEINIAREKLATTDQPALVVADYSDAPFQDVFFSEQQLSPEEAAFVRSASIGDINGPIRDEESFMLYKLIDKMSAPDSVKLRMIIIPEGMDRVAANAKADSIVNVIKQGKDFATVANEVYPQSNGGEVGWRIEPQLSSMGREFVNACFSSPVGQISKVNVQGQIYIVKTEDKTKPVDKYKLAFIYMPVTVSDQTLNSIENEINEFVANNSDGKNFIQAATENGYNLFQNTKITGSQPGLSMIGGSRQVINWAFNDKIGSVKKFDLPDHKVVAMINTKINAGYLPISEVSNALKAELIRNKKAEKIIADLKSKNLTNLGAYAETLNTKVDTVRFITFDTPNIMGLGRESALNVYAELGTIGKLEGPAKGDNGVFVINVLDKTDQSDSVDLETYKQNTSGQNMYRIMSQAMYALKDKMNVVDNRIILF